MAKRSPLAEKLDSVRDRIAAACARARREPSEVTLVAVTKTAAPEQIREILTLGVSDLGESRVQQLAQRAGQMNEFHQRRLTHGDFDGRWARIQVFPDVDAAGRVDSIFTIATDIHARFGNRELMVVSPDVGGVVRARGLAKRLNNAPLAIVDKRREKAGESEVMNIIGDVDGRTCILVDDIVDSAGTLCNAAAALKQQGAVEVFAYCTHGVLSGGAAARVAKSELSELVVTDSIWSGEADPKGGKIRRLTIAPLLAEAIRRIADETSVSSLFD